MHIPDNYLSPQTCAVMGAVMVPVWSICVKKIKDEVTAKKIPLLGISAAFSFLIMMFNIPLPGGTTAHATGAALIAILMGPYAASIAVSIALLIQALLFGDGGILSFGANSFNMAFVIPFTAYAVYRTVIRFWKNDKSKYFGAFLGGYLGIVAASFFAAVEFGIQPIFFRDASGPLYCPYPLAVSIPAMIIPHLFVGFIEGIIAAGVLAYVRRVSPGIVAGDSDKKFILSPLYIILAVLTILTPVGILSTAKAWGEWSPGELKEKLGSVPLPRAIGHGFTLQAPLRDYNFGMLKNDWSGYLISGVAGLAVIFLLFRIIKAFTGPKKNPEKQI